MENKPWDIEGLSIELTRIKSIVGTPGEAEISEHIFRMLSELEYFRRRPGALRFIPISGDELGRKCVLALLEPDEASTDALLCIGHTDTVGISDYASAADVATEPDALPLALSGMEMPKEVRDDIESGGYIFGRGIFDMKTGVAALMALIRELAGELGQLKSNVAFAFLPDEEGASSGMLSAVAALNSISLERGWKFSAAIDTDYMTGKSEGDEKKYVYVGSVGKLLPSFYVHGEQSHVGEAFAGLDPNFLASFLMSRIDLNPELCDSAEGEMTQPPISLRLRDLKQHYSVQTAEGTFLYFNYSTHSESPDEVMEKLKKEALAAFQEASSELNRRRLLFAGKAGMPRQTAGYEPCVITYSQLIDRLREDLGCGLDSILKAFDDGEGSSLDDLRDYSLGLIRELNRHLKDQRPKIIAFFCPPYYPHVYVKGEDAKERRLLAAVHGAVDEARGLFDYDIAVRKFYPYISDLSYCRLPEGPGAISALTANMPAWGRRYELPLSSIAGLSVPVVNIGPYGKDAHKISERVSKKYSHDAMPFILRKVVLTLAGR